MPKVLETPKSLCVVGLGLVGTSVALAARRRWPDVRVIGVDRRERLLHPTVARVCDLASPELAVAGEADTIVLAPPVDAILEMLPVLPRLAPAASVVMDTGSTKRAIVEAARAAGLESFVGGHPMAGGAESGPDHARPDLFDDRPWFIVDEGVPPEITGRACALAEGLGAAVVPVEADWHDRVMAAVSHLPQIVASVLMSTAGEAVGERDLQWSGAGLRDMTRLAASAGSSWVSILGTNADYVRPLLIELAEALEAVAGDLERADALTALFANGNFWKRAASAPDLAAHPNRSRRAPL